MPSACSTAGPNPVPACGARLRGPASGLVFAAVLLAAYLLPAARGAEQADIAGRYEHVGMVAAMLEIRPVPDGWAIRLEGGGSRVDDAAAAADCVVEAQGRLRDRTLEARFGDDASRGLVIDTRPGVAEVLEADTFGLCGLGTSFLGSYRRR